ncbi:hypothetical protein [Nocardia panacis]|uniref:hypothetical protein n=1 Tax=Nocardia panacis TaxID=2340916 RepID=UPI0011C3CE61|nr:hypothetical protein [Nocardia panacis]
MRTAIVAYAGALAHFGDVLNICGYNWGTAEYNATIGAKGAPPALPPRAAVTPMGDAGFPPMPDPKGDNGAGLVIRGAGTVETWEGAPNGRADALDAAATAWTAFSRSHELDNAATILRGIRDSFEVIHAPEVPDIKEALDVLAGGADGIRDGAAMLATELRNHHDGLLDARQRLSATAPAAFTRHPGAVSTTVDNTVVRVSVDAELSGDDVRAAYSHFTTAASNTSLFDYLAHCADRDGFRGVVGADVLKYVPQLRALKELPLTTVSGDPRANVDSLERRDNDGKPVSTMDVIATWEAPQAALTAVDPNALDKYGPLVKNWAMLAVKYGNEAGVDPRMVLAMALQEGAPLRTGYPRDGVTLPQALSDPGSFHPDPKGPQAGVMYDELRLNSGRLGASKHGRPIFNYDGPGNSIGLTNMKEDPFNEIATRYQDKFSGQSWSDLAGNDDLAMKAAAYNLKMLNEEAASHAESRVKAGQPLDQFLGSGYNAGGLVGRSEQVARGVDSFRDGSDGGNNEVEHGRSSVSLVALANQILCGSGAYR